MRGIQRRERQRLWLVKVKQQETSFADEDYGGRANALIEAIAWRNGREDQRPTVHSPTPLYRGKGRIPQLAPWKDANWSGVTGVMLVHRFEQTRQGIVEKVEWGRNLAVGGAQALCSILNPQMGLPRRMAFGGGAAGQGNWRSEHAS